MASLASPEITLSGNSLRFPQGWGILWIFASIITRIRASSTTLAKQELVMSPTYLGSLRLLRDQWHSLAL